MQTRPGSRTQMGRASLLAMAAVVTVSLAATACSVVSSQAINDLGGEPVERTGVYYALPMGLVDISLAVNAQRAEYRVFVSDTPTYVADPRRSYLLRYRPLPNYEDNITITVNKSLIKTVSATTEDKTGDIILELAKAFKRGESFFQSVEIKEQGFEKIANVTIDPTDEFQLSEAQMAFNMRAVEVAGRLAALKCAPGEEAGTKVDAGLCTRFTQYARGGGKSNLIQFFPNRSPPPPGGGAAADCSVGLCYRAKEPYTIHWTVDGVHANATLELPNNAPLIEIDVRRAFLVKKIQSLTFDDNGFLQTANVKKDSELLAVSALPLAVLNALAAAGTPFRVEVNNQRNEIAKARSKEAAAKSELIAAQAKARAPGSKGEAPK